TPEEARAFLEVVHGDRLEALYTVALALGLRRGEALGLQWGDLNFERGTLAVRASLQRAGGKLQLMDTKTEQSRRTVRLPKMVTAALRTHRERQMFEARAAGTRWQETGYVFTSSLGTPID